MSESSSELVMIDKGKVLEVYSTPGGLDPLLDQMKEAVQSFEHDMSTAASRKRTASLANKVAKVKTYLDGLGKELTTDWKEKAKAVDVERKNVRDRADALKIVAREPLTTWEEDEATRIAGHRRGIEEMKAAAIIDPQMPKGSTEIRTLIGGLTSVALGESWEEFQEQATAAKMESLGILENLLAASTKQEEDAAELERLKAADAIRLEKEEADKVEADRKAEEERIANEAKEAAEKVADDKRVKAEKDAAEKLEKERTDKEAAEKAKADAEAETKRLEQEKVDNELKAKADKEKADADKVTAKELAEKQIKDAAEKARTDEVERQDAAKKKEAAELLARQENVKRVTALKTSSKKALIEAGLTEADAITVVKSVIDNKIPHIQFIY